MTIYGPAADIDARPAYLFQCDDMYAVSLDPTGSNIPMSDCFGSWTFLAQFALGVHEAVPVHINPEPILRGVLLYGYYVWREGTARSEGTTQ